MNQVSRVVPIAVVIAGIVMIAGVLVVVLHRGAIFATDPVSPSLQTNVWVTGVARTGTGAEAKRDRARSLAVAFFRQRGFIDAQIAPEPPRPIDYEQDSHVYVADQIVDLRSVTFAPLARAMNALQRDVDPTERTVSGTFPTPPFLPLAFAVCILYVALLSISVAALETREADVNRAPRGMHPFYVATQTLLIGLLVLLAMVDAHALLPASRVPFIVAAALGVGILLLWLFKTRNWWQQTVFLRCAFVAYVIATVLVIVSDVLALRVPLT
ncbi:MAG TPA: hypothetical protein VGG89_04645 [Candidatus Baltobacteraceae bacterium]